VCPLPVQPIWFLTSGRAVLSEHSVSKAEALT
jgi:hypothetical protein